MKACHGQRICPRCRAGNFDAVPATVPLSSANAAWIPAFAGMTAGGVPGCAVRTFIPASAGMTVPTLESSFPRRRESIGSRSAPWNCAPCANRYGTHAFPVVPAQAGIHESRGVGGMSIQAESRLARNTPGNAGVPSARAGGPQWTTRRRSMVAHVGGAPTLPGIEPAAVPFMPRRTEAKPR